MNILRKTNVICCQGTLYRHVQYEHVATLQIFLCFRVIFVSAMTRAKNKTHSLPARGNSVGAASAFYFPCSSVSDQRVFAKCAAAADIFLTDGKWFDWACRSVCIWEVSFMGWDADFKLSDTIPASIKSLITIWPVTLVLVLSGSRGEVVKVPRGEKHHHKCSLESLKCLVFALSLSLSGFVALFPLLSSVIGCTTGGWGEEDGVVLEERRRRRRRTAGFLLSELEPSHASGQCSETKRRRRRRRRRQDKRKKL